MLGRKRTYDRSRLLADAARAQRRGRPRKAVELYRQILRAEPANVRVHRRLGPLLARTGQGDDAWRSFRSAAEALAQQGFVEQALGVYRDAAHHLPREAAAWLAIAELEAKRGRRGDAIAALRTGRSRLRSRRDRAGAIRLLERAHALEPSDAELGVDLARLLGKAGERARALALLDSLAARAPRRALRRVRARQLLLAPGPASLWRWLAALRA